MARQNLGKDLQSRVLGGDTIPTNSGARQPFGTATSAPTTTTITDTGRTWNANEWLGHMVASGNVYGVVLSNTSTALTIDKWYAPNNPGGAAGTTPSNGDKYVILTGGAPVWWMGLSENASIAVTDTTLGSELSGSGWTRQIATWAHTTNTTSYTLTALFTSSDGTTRTIASMGLFNASSAGVMMFETLVSPTAVMVSGDQVTLTDTISI